MLERFTPTATQVVNAAKDCAAGLSSDHVNTEHLLYGLVAVRKGVASEILRSFKITADAVRDMVKDLHPDAKNDGTIAYEPEIGNVARDVLTRALRESVSLGHESVGTEHLLLALARSPNGKATLVLSELEVDTKMIVDAVLERIRAGSGTDTKPSETGTVSSGRGTGKGPDSSRRSAKRSDLKSLRSYGRNLTEIAKSGTIDPLVGRDEEVERLMQVLIRRTKNNPMLIGEPGVGKTALVEGLALRIAKGEVPVAMQNLQVWSLDLSGMIAGTKLRGEFEKRVKSVIKEVQDARDVVLFIDEIHTVVGAGGSIGASEMMKPSLARGEFPVIGATTIDEYRKYIEKDSALARRFQPIEIEVPSTDHTRKILLGVRDRYELHHRVSIPEAAIDLAVKLSDRLIPDRRQPDKALDVIDEAASRASIRSTRGADGQAVVTLDDVADVVSMWTGVPAGDVSLSEGKQLLHMESTISEMVIGQRDAVSAVSRAIRRSRSGLRDAQRPVGSFLFLGPTGVGKTELARALSKQLFGDQGAMIRLDMSEYMESASVSRLIGAPPGYIGHNNGGQLTDAVRSKPYSVVLLDEIEKAHPDIANLLLQIFDDGHLTDSQGRKVDFSNSIIIMTSNVGAQHITAVGSFGFGPGETSQENIEQIVLSEARKHFRPELLGRIDEQIVFSRLTEQDLRAIARLLVDEVITRVEDQPFSIAVSEDVISWLVNIAHDPALGARPIRRAIQQNIENAIADVILTGTCHRHVSLDILDEELQITAI